MSDLNVSLLRSFCIERFKKRNLGVIHGVSHWDRVAENGKRLFCPGADTDVINAFAYLHDVERYNNGRDLQHGERATRVIDSIRHDLLSALSDVQVDKLKRACKQHTTTAKTGDITIDICFDADRLDLYRVGIKPDPDRMATEIGKRLVLDNIRKVSGKRFIFALFEVTAKYNNGIISDPDLITRAFFKYGLYGENRFAMIEAAERYNFSDAALGSLLRVAFTFGAAPIPQLGKEEKLFDRVRPKYLMTSKEMKCYTDLPETLILYRGTSMNEFKSGILSPSWTDDLDRAKTFALHGSGYESDQSDRVVIKVEVKKKYIKAVLLQGFAIYTIKEIVYYYHGESNISIVYQAKKQCPNNSHFAHKKRILYKDSDALRAAEVMARIDGIWPEE